MGFGWNRAFVFDQGVDDVIVQRLLDLFIRNSQGIFKGVKQRSLHAAYCQVTALIEDHFQIQVVDIKAVKQLFINPQISKIEQEVVLFF